MLDEAGIPDAGHERRLSGRVDDPVAIGAQHRGRDINVAEPAARIEPGHAVGGLGEHAHVVTAHLRGGPREETGGPLRAHPTQQMRARGRHRGKVARQHGSVAASVARDASVTLRDSSENQGAVAHSTRPATLSG